jgi:hypothetical protein
VRVKPKRTEVAEEFIPLPVIPVVEVSLNLGEDWDGTIRSVEIPKTILGANVKLLLRVSERWFAELDREVFQAAILKSGAVSCRPPVVHVVRKREARDERHAAELTLEESLRIFAEEVRAPDSVERVAFAAALAREADAGAED